MNQTITKQIKSTSIFTEENVFEKVSTMFTIVNHSKLSFDLLTTPIDKHDIKKAISLNNIGKYSHLTGSFNWDIHIYTGCRTASEVKISDV